MNDDRFNNFLLSIFFKFYGLLLLPTLKLYRNVVVFLSIKGKNEIVKKVLINFGEHFNAGLGDAIMLNTLIRMVKQKYKDDTRIFLIVHRDNLFLDSFWKKHSCVDEFICHPPTHYKFLFEWPAFFLRLKREMFDLSLMYTPSSVNNVRDIWFPVDPALTFVLGVRDIIGYFDRWNEDSFFLRKIDISKTHWTHIAAEYAAALGLPAQEIKEFSRPHFSFKKEPLALDTDSSLKISINHGGGRSWNRMWPFDRFVLLCIKLINAYEATIFLVGGPEEVEERNQIMNTVKTEVEAAKIFSVNAKTLNETANYIAASHLFIGNDSGPTHLAAAVGTPVIAIFGPSNSNYLSPHGFDTRHRVVKLSLECQPCEILVNKTGRMSCFREHDKFKCLNDLSLDTVWDVVRSKIKELERSEST